MLKCSDNSEDTWLLSSQVATMVLVQSERSTCMHYQICGGVCIVGCTSKNRSCNLSWQQAVCIWLACCGVREFVKKSAASAASPDHVKFQAVIKSAASAASLRGGRASGRFDHGLLFAFFGRASGQNIDKISDSGLLTLQYHLPACRQSQMPVTIACAWQSSQSPRTPKQR